MAQQRDDSFWNWLGRQVGHVKKAVQADVTKPPAPQLQNNGTAKPQAAAQPKGEPTPPPDTPQVIYRDAKAEEVELPDQPGVKLRRTIIDEVIVEEMTKKGDSSQ
jgi:hypothetical protein